MRKVGVCAIAAALLFTAGGVQEAQAAHIVVVPGFGNQISCENIEEWKDKLEGMGGKYEWLSDLLSKLPCGDAPEAEVPEQPGTPEDELPEQPDVNVPVIPEVPENRPEVKPEVQDQAYVYGLRITELVNKHRAAAGLNPVTYSAELSKPAQTRAFEIEKSFSHTRPDGRYFSTALKDYGISYRFCGENIAWGQKSPEEVVTAWMNSPSHRANILHKSFTKLGVGYQQNARGVNYFVQLFSN